MAKKWIHKDGESKIVNFHDVVAHYVEGWTDAVERKEPMTEAEIAAFQAKVSVDTSPCPTCGHRKATGGNAAPAPIEVPEVVVEVDDDEPVDEGEEPKEESGISYAEYTNAELIEMIVAEGEKPAAGAKKADLIKTLKFIRGE